VEGRKQGRNGHGGGKIKEDSGEDLVYNRNEGEREAVGKKLGGGVGNRKRLRHTMPPWGE